MLADKFKYGLLLCAVACVVSCSKKELPEGQRISVIPTVRLEEQEVSARNNVVLPNPTTNFDWSQNGGNNEHLLGNLAGKFPMTRAWGQKFGVAAGKRDLLISEPIVMDGVVYTIDAKARVSAFSLGDGKKLWDKNLLTTAEKKSDVTLKSAGIAANKTYLFAATGFGEVVALNLKTGKEVWRHDVQTPIRIAPTCSSYKVFVQTIDNKLIALDARYGDEIWNYEVLQEDTTLLGGASPAFSLQEDMLIAAFSSGELQAIKASTGSPLWNTVLVSNKYAATHSPINTIKANPVIDEGVVYAISNSKTFAAIDILSGERIWEKTISGVYQPIISGDYVFVLSSTNFLTAMKKADGSLVWSTKLPLTDEDEDEGSVFALRPLMINGNIFVALSNGKVLKISAKNGAVEDKLALTDELFISPVLATKNLIFTTTNAEIAVYR